MYSAETLTWAGRTRLLGVSSRLMSPEPYFREEITAFPVAFPEVRRAALERWLGEVLAVIGYTDRFAHVEFVLTAGGPEVVEVNPGSAPWSARACAGRSARTCTRRWSRRRSAAAPG